MKRILSFLIIAVIGVLTYNYYYGSEEDKARSREVTEKAKDLGVTVVNLLKAEKENFKNGKYEKAFDKVGGLFKEIGKKAEELGGNFPDRVKELENKMKELKSESERQKSAPSANPEASQKEVGNKMEKILQELEVLTKDMKKKE